MIVLYSEEGWQIITQRTHGLVAAQLAFHWQVKERPERWLETVLAIAEHDDAENELDGEELLTLSGGPLNFDMKVFDLEHCQQLASLSITKSRYIALLTSMHMSFLYQKDKNNVPGADAFLKEQTRLQAKWRNELGMKTSEAKRSYALLEWCDALSLLICKGEMQSEERGIEISTGPDKEVYQLKQIDDKALTVQPWPFEEKEFAIQFEKRTLKTLQFTSSAQFRKEFLAAPVEELTWQLKKSDGIKSDKRKRKTSV